MGHTRAAAGLRLLVPILLASLVAGCGGGPDPNLDLGGIDMGAAFDGLLSRTQHALAGINGIEGAKRADAELRLINQDFDDLIYHLPSLNDEGREALAAKAARALPDLQRLTERIGGMPALDDEVGDTLRGTLARLEQVR